MKTEIYSENTHRLLFTVFDSTKEHKTNIFRTHLHPDLEIGFILDGSGTYILNTEELHACPNDTFLVRPNEQHCVPTIDSPILRSINIHITSYYIWNFCSEYIDISRLYLLVGKNTQDKIMHKYSNYSSFFSELSNLCADEKAAENRFRIRNLVLQLLISITSSFPKSDNQSPALKNILTYQEDIQNAILYINNNLCQRITLDDIAKNVGYSRSHFSAIFRELTGVSPYEYLILQRIEKAVELLKNSNMSITEISQACGFCNISNFNKSFLKITGITPSDYRTSKPLNSQKKSKE